VGRARRALGANGQPGQPVVLEVPIEHRDAGVVLAKSAYRAGAAFVDVALSDAGAQRARAMNAREE
jgi:leucyl aminopeptidase (aminopeptidase T)